MLDVYESVDPGSAFSVNGAWTDPFKVSADGFHGQVQFYKMYVRNDDLAKWYDTLEISVQQTLGGIDWIGGTDEHSWKFVEGDAEPSEAEWELVSPANTIVLTDIGSAGGGDISTYLPFWVRVEIDDRTAVRSITDIVSLTLDFEEYTV